MRKLPLMVLATVKQDVNQNKNKVADTLSLQRKHIKRPHPINDSLSLYTFWLLPDCGTQPTPTGSYTKDVILETHIPTICLKKAK